MSLTPFVPTPKFEDYKQRFKEHFGTGERFMTGTPSGVGASRKPPVLLKEGDTVRVEISGPGVLENPVIAER